MQKFVAITGPTSSGKTSLALKLCRKFDGEVVSFDSRQVYKYMDIGTGKLPINFAEKIEKRENFWQFDGIKVWGYDVVKPNEFFSVFDYKKFFSGLKFTKPVVFIVGGTGFYLDILLGTKKVAGVEPDHKLREVLSGMPVKKLHQKLLSLNPKWGGKVDQNNPVRLIRAIEIEKHLGNAVKMQHPQGEDVLCDLKLCLTSERPSLYEKVDNWVEYVFKHGFIDEVKSLVEMGFENAKPMQGLNYKTALGYLRGELSETEAIKKIQFENHSYIRRQQTYFKKMQGFVEIDTSKQGFDSKVERLVESSLNG